MILPSLSQYTHTRPERYDFEPPYLIPDMREYASFWNTIYHRLNSLSYSSPLDTDVFDYINTDIGFYGPRPHPNNPARKYFHIGIQLDIPKGAKVTPVLDGILEYSGYGAINGYYVLLSHPDIRTEDGYILHTMYCHLKKPAISFTSYQKMLREISLGSYPLIPVSSDDILGEAGQSGLVDYEKNLLYLQMDFRKFGETPIVIDPLRVLKEETRMNSEG